MIEIQITEQHIKEGKPKRCALCPVALALKESLNVSVVSVYYDTIIIVHKVGDVRSYQTPKDLREFLKNLDACRPMKPLKFELPIKN